MDPTAAVLQDTRDAGDRPDATPHEGRASEMNNLVFVHKACCELKNIYVLKPNRPLSRVFAASLQQALCTNTSFSKL